MSSSPSRAREKEKQGPTAPQPEAAPAPEGVPFVYGEVAAPAPGAKAALNLPATVGKKTSEAALAARAGEQEAQARQQGRQQGEAESRAKFEEQLGRERQAVAKAVADFAHDRAAFYRKLEDAAVRLALSIARKILHRETQVDPLLLMGIVRAALEKIEGATGVTLVVNPKQVAEWRQYFAERPELAAPDIVEDAAMPGDQCGLKTAMGTTEIGVEMQLKEIEQRLMDLLAARPQDEEKGKKP
ncbi:MAG: FliH/SctL family protein [Candidatus Sulfotelmatobacter sp.]